MPLPMPVLDDRDYQVLVDGMRERLPRSAPPWSDHNVSDPGITLLELLAYLGDSLLYRLDRIPERHYRAFLRLLGCEPRAARCALAPVAFGTREREPGRDLRSRVQIADATGEVVFQTVSALHVSEARIATVLTVTGGRWVDRTTGDTLDTPYAPFGAPAQIGDALYLGFDRAPGPEGALLRLFVLGEDFSSDVTTWLALRAEWRRGISRRRACRRAGAPSRFWDHYGARVVWEFFDGTDWQALPNLKDRTRALSLSGPVRWRHTLAHRPGGVAGHDTKYFIRCRIIDGEFDCVPQIRGVVMNAVIARHAVDAMGVIMPARSTGAAGQRFQLPEAPVVPGSVRLSSVWRGSVRSDWRERADLERSGPHAPHFVLEAPTGGLLFGDGRNGVVPEAETELRADWKAGGGAAGNVSRRTVAVARGAAAGLEVERLADACGGADAETLDETKARAFRALAEQRCAATLEDLSRVAQSAPALPVACAFAVLAHPDLECLPAAGCVTVVIVPRCVDSHPIPSAALCRAVANHIELRRPLALEVHVTGPRYTRVGVHAELALERGAVRARIVAQAEAALRKFLHPLGGGPDANGWTVGRSVYRSEVLAVLDAIPGVHHVVSLDLVGGDDSPSRCGDIVLCANGLVSSGQHVITAIDGAVR